MIDQQTIERIFAASDIYDVVSDYVSLRKRGANFIGLCPFHNEKTPSFNVNPARGIYKCFGCGKGGNSVNFIMEHEHLSYPEALKFLAKKAGIEIQERELTQEDISRQNDRESLFAVNDFAVKYFSQTLHSTPEGRSVGLNYFYERGFRDDIIKKFQLGYSLETRDALSKEALKNGFKQTFLEKSGLSILRENGTLFDRFFGRVMFPVHNLSGKIVAFGGRVLKKSEKTAKYVNSPASEIYDKSRELYGLFFAKKSILQNSVCYLVEGYTDVISMHQAGIENVVSSSGTSLTTEQINLLHRFTENIVVLYDGDSAGIKAAIRGIDMLLKANMNVRVVLLPEGEDPDSFARTHNADEFVNYINKNQTDFIYFKANLLNEEAKHDPIKKSVVVGEVLQSIAIIENSILVAEYIKTCSQIFEISENVLYRELNKFKKKARENQKTPVANSQPQPVAEPEISAEIPTNSQLDKIERSLLEFAIRYGGEFVSWGEENVKLVKFVVEDLKNDGLELQNPLFRAMILEEYTKIDEPNFNAEKHFISHPNPKFSALATDIIAEKYQLSKIFTKNPLQEKCDRLEKENPADKELEHLRIRLQEQKKQENNEHKRWLETAISNQIYEYKKTILGLQIDELKKKMQHASTEKMLQIMKEITEKNEFRRQLARAMGQVVI